MFSFSELYFLHACATSYTPFALLAFSGVARVLRRGVLEGNYGREAPEKFRPEATPTNYYVIIAVSGGRNYIEREGSSSAT